jgi:hypothetical protein
MDIQQLDQGIDVCNAFSHLLVFGKAVKVAAKSGRQTASLAFSAGLGYSLSSQRCSENILPNIVGNILCQRCEKYVCKC